MNFCQVFLAVALGCANAQESRATAAPAIPPVYNPNIYQPYFQGQQRYYPGSPYYNPAVPAAYNAPVAGAYTPNVGVYNPYFPGTAYRSVR